MSSFLDIASLRLTLDDGGDDPDSGWRVADIRSDTSGIDSLQSMQAAQAAMIVDISTQSRDLRQLQAIGGMSFRAATGNRRRYGQHQVATLSTAERINTHVADDLPAPIARLSDLTAITSSVRTFRVLTSGYVHNAWALSYCGPVCAEDAADLAHSIGVALAHGAAQLWFGGGGPVHEPARLTLIANCVGTDPDRGWRANDARRDDGDVVAPSLGAAQDAMARDVELRDDDPRGLASDGLMRFSARADALDDDRDLRAGAAAVLADHVYQILNGTQRLQAGGVTGRPAPRTTGPIDQLWLMPYAGSQLATEANAMAAALGAALIATDKNGWLASRATVEAFGR